MTAPADQKSANRPYSRLAKAMLPPMCMEYAEETRPRISSGTTDWITVWVMVMNPEVPNPIMTAAIMEMPVWDDSPIPMGVRLLVKPSSRNTFPRVMWLMMPPTNIEENRAPIPRAAISAYTSFSLNVTPSADSFSNARGGSMDSKDITRTQWATAMSRMPKTSGVLYA